MITGNDARAGGASPGEVRLREITVSTVRAVTDLRVEPDQERYVASNAVSIAEAYFHPEAWFRAIYRDDVPCGFAMLRDPRLARPPDDERDLSLWRFMIDRRHQRCGIGRRALALVIEHARTIASSGWLHTSYVPGPRSPLEFYRSAGFVPAGEPGLHGEIGLRLRIFP